MTTKRETEIRGTGIRMGRPRVPRGLAIAILAVSLGTSGIAGAAPGGNGNGNGGGPPSGGPPPHVQEPATTTTTAPAPATAGSAPVTTTTTAPPVVVGSTGLTTDPKYTAGWIRQVAATIGADNLWQRGYTGRGVDIAVIDTGIAPVPGSNLVVNGLDISYEGQDPALRFLDGYGHGTHMAGIINGSDPKLGPDPAKYAPEQATAEQFVGIAPQSRVVNVRVGNSDGTVDVSQVIAAINWVIENQRSNGLNIRVLNLSYGTDSTQPYSSDPLAFAVEKAWQAGIVVVAAAGNEGFGAPGLDMPAADPYVIAVGASDQRGTPDRVDDVVAAFSNRGTAERRVDVIAPGTTTYSLRTPGSFLDEMYPEARVGDRMFRGNGTSEAAAVVSGAVALMLQVNPGWSPDEIKGRLRATGKSLAWDGTATVDENQRLIHVWEAVIIRNLKGIDWHQRHPRSTGLGSLEASRGSAHVEAEGSVLAGELDVFGRAWNAKSWREQSEMGRTWGPKGYWSDLDIAGPEWGPDRWTGRSWRTGDWTGRSWRTDDWSGRSWRSGTWSGRSWRTESWSGRSWRGEAWSGRSWRGQVWSGSASGDGL